MSRRHQFEVGDMIKILDGHGIEDYAGGWYPIDMNHLIGKIYKIFDIYDSETSLRRKNSTRYRIKDELGNEWSIDERGAEKIEINRPVIISERISKKGRRVIKARQDGVVACAVCHPDDKFNYFYGADIALKRLKEAQKRKARREAIAKKKAEIEALMENNYMTKGFVI